MSKPKRYELTAEQWRRVDLALKSRWRYYVVYPEGALRHQKIRAFRDWLLTEMAGR